MAASDKHRAAEQSAIRPARAIAGCTFLSRILGFVRDVLSAHFFGTGMAMDAFVLAFTVPNLFRRLFGEGALSAAFIPVFTEYRERRRAERSHDRAEATRLFSVCLTSLSIVLGAAVVAGWAVCWLLPRVAPLSDKMALCLGLLRVMLPYALFICVAALFAAALQVHGQFAIPALAPVLLNVCWIAGLVLLCPTFGIYGIAAAVLLGGALQAAMQVRPLARRGTRVGLVMDWRHEGMRRVARLMLPVMVGLGVMQVNVLFDRIIAEACVPGHGANSALYFGNRLMQFPLGVFGIAMATAVFPALSRYAVAGDNAGLLATLQRSVRIILFITLPTLALTVVLRQEIVSLVFQRGGFDAESTRRTASVLMFYILGLWAYSGLHIVTRAFYAMQDTRTPVRVGVAMVGCNLALNLTLVWALQEAGLALSTAITGAANLGIMLYLLRRRLGAIGGAALLRSALRSGAAACVAAIGAWIALAAATHLVVGDGLGQRFARMFLPMLAGGVLMVGVGWLARTRELRELVEVFGGSRRTSRTRPPSRIVR